MALYAPIEVLEGFIRRPVAGLGEKILQGLLSPADVKINGKRPWDLRIHDPRVFKRVLLEGSLGAGESYMDGWWDCPRLDEFFHRILQTGFLEEIDGNFRALLLNLVSRLMNLQSKVRSFEVAEKHYDLGNELYAAMLDSRMIYSCGYWKGVSTLDEAQEAKLDLVCRKLHLKPGMSLLDIGCGWGGMAKFAAERYGASVVGITISQKQAKLAQKICKGLPVEIRLQDYREMNQRFDRIVSLGMFEHVGYKNYRTFMKVAHRCLQEEGLFLLQTIGAKVSATYSDEWFHKYIFPNGMLPSPKQISEAIESLFVMEDWHNFGADYDKTLMAWYANFCAHWEKLKTRYGAKFRRMWTYYLLSLSGAFRARKTQLWQIVFSPKGINGGYVSVR